MISEYREAILAAEDNFSELASLRPVLDSHGDPVMSSGNFAVVFKMRDENDGKLYAVKCFTKDQQGRDESYRKIADEMEVVSSSYILPLRYLENELFVDSDQCECEEFPVVVMEWVEGETLDSYLMRNLNDKYELEMLSYRFNRMSAWLLAQPFAHGDLKPDNILVRKDGSLVLVDYDGMFVPSMKGDKAREIGSPDYRHPLRNDSDFNEHIDDFSIAVISLSLKAIALNPNLKSKTETGDTLLLSEKEIRSPQDSKTIKGIQSLTNDSDLSTLLGIFYIAYAKNSLEAISFRLFMTGKPKTPAKKKLKIAKPVEKIDTSCSDKDITEGVADEFGVIYSKDGKRLLKCKSNLKLSAYNIKTGTKVICDGAFDCCGSLRCVNIPDSVTSIGEFAFSKCSALQSISIPDSVNSIGDWAFSLCLGLQSISIPDSVNSIGECAFYSCSALQSISIPDSVTSIGEGAFYSCFALQSISIPDSVTSIGKNAFDSCYALQSVSIPNSVTFIGDNAFSWCKTLLSVSIPNSVTEIGHNPFENCSNVKIILSSNSSFRIINDLLISSNGVLISCLNRSTNITIPDSVTSIGEFAFSECSALQSISIPDSVTSIGEGAFYSCSALQSISIPNSVTYIGDYAFYLCSALQSVSIPNSVTSIGKNAFSESCKVIRR